MDSSLQEDVEFGRVLQMVTNMQGVLFQTQPNLN